MDRVTAWWGIAVLVFVLGCGSSGPAPQSPPGPPGPESSRPQPGGSDSDSASLQMPAESAAPAAAKSASPPPASVPAAAPAPVPASAPASAPAASAQPERSEPSASGQSEPPPAAGGGAAPGPDQLRSWAAALVGNDVSAREAASERLERVSVGGGQWLLSLLQDASPDVRRGAVFYWLDRFDPADAAVVAALAKRLSDPDASVRKLALTAAQRFPLDTIVQSLPQLTAMLGHPQESAESRAAAARLIGTLDAAAHDAVPALAKAAAADPDPAVRSACVLSICRAAPAADAVAALRQVLRQDSQANLRGLAATRLGKLGQATAAVAPELAEALADRDDGVRRKAADALALSGAAAVAPTMQKLQAPDVAVRRLAVFVLAKLGPDAKPALEALRKLQQDPDAEIKQLAELAVRRIEGTP